MDSRITHLQDCLKRKLASEAAKKGQERISDNETKQKLFLAKQPAIDKLNQTLVYDPNKSNQTLVYDPVKQELSSMNDRILKLDTKHNFILHLNHKEFLITLKEVLMEPIFQLLMKFLKKIQLAELA